MSDATANGRHRGATGPDRRHAAATPRPGPGGACSIPRCFMDPVEPPRTAATRRPGRGSYGTGRAYWQGRGDALATARRRFKRAAIDSSGLVDKVQSPSRLLPATGPTRQPRFLSHLPFLIVGQRAGSSAGTKGRSQATALGDLRSAPGHT